MAIALVAHANAHGQNGGTTGGVNTTGANFTRIAVAHLTSTFSGTISDSNGNTYVQAGTTIGVNTAYISYFYCTSPVVGTGHTATASQSNIFAAVLFAAYSGVKTSSPVEATFTSNTNGLGATTISPGSLTPTSNNALLELIGTQSGTPTVVTCGDVLYNTLDTVLGDGATTITGAAYSYVQTTATASNPAFNANAATTSIGAVLFAIDEATGGGGSVGTIGIDIAVGGVGASNRAGVGTIGIAIAVAGVSLASGTILPNDPGIVYSPYNWYVTSAVATTINPGAYMRTMFAGNSCVMNFDVSLMSSTASQLWYRIDLNTWTKVTVSTSTLTLTIPTDLLVSGAFPYHLLEVIFKADDTSINRWDTTSTSGTIKFTGLTLDSGSSVITPDVFPKNILIYGDSITEGILDLGTNAANALDHADAQGGWAYKLREALGVEVGVVGFAGQGYAIAGSGSVPNISTAYNLIYQGRSRTFTPTPDLIVNNEGANDWINGTNTTTVGNNAQTTYNGLLAACPSTTQIVLAPLPPTTGATYLTAIQGAVTAVASAKVIYNAATNVFITAYGTQDNIHPSSANNQAFIVYRIALILKPYLQGGTTVVVAPNIIRNIYMTEEI